MSAREEKVADHPLKNGSSHPHDALQYLALGSSGRRGLIDGVGSKKRRRPVREETDWDPHAF